MFETTTCYVVVAMLKVYVRGPGYVVFVKGYVVVEVEESVESICVWRGMLLVTLSVRDIFLLVQARAWVVASFLVKQTLFVLAIV